MTTQERIKEIEERLEKAAPGPWVSPWNDDNKNDNAIVDVNNNAVVTAIWHDEALLSANEDDANFIAHTPEDIQFLLEALEEAKSKAAPNEKNKSMFCKACNMPQMDKYEFDEQRFK